MNILSKIKTNRPINYRYFPGIHNIDGWTHLHDKAYRGTLLKTDIRELTPIQIDIRDDFGQSPLYWSVEASHYEISSMLLAKGADPNQTDNLGRTLFHVIKSTELVDLLLEYGVPYDKCDVYGIDAIEELSDDDGYVINSNTMRVIEQRKIIANQLADIKKKLIMR